MWSLIYVDKVASVTGVLEAFPCWPWCTKIAHNNLQTGVECLSKSKYSLNIIQHSTEYSWYAKKCIFEIFGKTLMCRNNGFYLLLFFIGIRYHIDIRPCTCVVFQPSFHWVKPQHLHEDNRKNCYTTNPRTSSHAMEFSYTGFLLVPPQKDFFSSGGTSKKHLAPPYKP